MKRDNAQKGSALVIILIAVAILAALSFAVSSMMKEGRPDMMGGERAKLHAEEITSYGRTLRQGVQNMKISNSCTDEDISFESPELTGYTHTPAAKDDCKIFSSKGGGIIYQRPTKDWLDMSIEPAPTYRGVWFFPARMCIPGTGTAESGCDNDSLPNEAIVAALPYIKRMICIEINNSLGVTNPGGNPPQDAGNAWASGWPKFTGGFTDGDQLDLPGVQAGCYEGNSADTPDGTYIFFQILQPR